MKLIPLTQGQYAMVDDEDYDHLMQWKWYAKKSKKRKQTYAARSEKTILMHRIVCKANKGELVDHKDHNGLNNQKINLRKCTTSQNCANRIPSGSSKYLGVSKHVTSKTKYKWDCKITHNKITKRIGFFSGNKQGEIEAAKAYDKMALELHGEFANLNFK